MVIASSMTVCALAASDPAVSNADVEVASDSALQREVLKFMNCPQQRFWLSLAGGLKAAAGWRVGRAENCFPHFGRIAFRSETAYLPSSH
jgi:hypothetical protein